ncbi:MAG: hypothetical protein A3F90_12965, partial [Deltaproteobacteria bacterium RIFCSPLOWO2_12_FULL_60_19]
WIDGTTRIDQSGILNPDGTKYRIRIHNQEKRRLAAERELEDCNDIDEIFHSTATLLQKRINKQSKDRKENERLRELNQLLPLPFTIWALGEYHPQPARRGASVINRGDHTRHILDLKKAGLSNAIHYFFEKLDEIVAEGSLVSMIPSSNPANVNAGLKAIVRLLAERGRMDASAILIRHQQIAPSQSGWYFRVDRKDVDRHLKSIKIVESPMIRRRVVLLLDDIVTTGTSFIACRKLLLDAGASEVICLALGMTEKIKD